MYRISKVLNHNTVIAIEGDSNKEYLIMGKGLGFGKKVAERFETGPEMVVYSLQEEKQGRDMREMAKSISPLFMEIAGMLLDEAVKAFGKVDRNILFPMAEHIEFAVKRISSGESISNPLTDDIRVLFHTEYKIAEKIRPIIHEQYQIEVTDDEIGYVTLHIHSAIEDTEVSASMQAAGCVRECISMIEKETGAPIKITSLSYNRLMNHIRYMLARALSGEKIKLNMNDYMEQKFPKAFEMSKYICGQMGKSLNCEIDETEIGYLAMHIERSMSEDQEEY
ncbi:MAG: PRD domain-containing protein [Acetatifactor sp.]